MFGGLLPGKVTWREGRSGNSPSIFTVQRCGQSDAWESKITTSNRQVCASCSPTFATHAPGYFREERGPWRPAPPPGCLFRLSQLGRRSKFCIRASNARNLITSRQKMDSITELPPAHIPLSSFPAATALAAQGVSRPPSPSSDKQSPYSTRPPSPNYLYLESGASSVIDYDSSYPPTPSEPASRDSSWGPPGTRSASRSKDPLFKRSLRGEENRNSLLSRWLGTTVREEEEERRGRRLSIGEAMGASVTGAPLQPSAKGKRWTTSREGAQKILAFAMIGLVGMNDSATGANVSRDSWRPNERIVVADTFPLPALIHAGILWGVL